MTESKFCNKFDYCKEGHWFCHEHTGKLDECRKVFRKGQELGTGVVGWLGRKAKRETLTMNTK